MGWLPVTPISRQSDNQQLNMVIVTAEGKLVSLIDIYGNILLEFESPEPVLKLRCSQVQTDSFVILLTESMNLLIYEIVLVRKGEPT